MEKAIGFAALYCVLWVLAMLWSLITGRWRDKGETYEKIWEGGIATLSFGAGGAAVGFVAIGLNADIGVLIILVLAAGVAAAIFPAMMIGESAKKPNAIGHGKNQAGAAATSNKFPLSCKIFGHKWQYCQCVRCGATRDQNHEWNGCRCLRCGAGRDENHAWDGCRCAVCGRQRNAEHDLDAACVCRRCGTTEHDWDLCVCRRCGAKRDTTVHDWKRCKCRKCGARRDEKHDWKIRKTEKDGTVAICAICGRRLAYYDWEPTPTEKEKCLHTCTVTGRTALIHTGKKCTCTVCGEKIPLHHVHIWGSWGKCEKCGMKYDFAKNLTNIGWNVETFDWTDREKDTNIQIGHRKYIEKGGFYDEHSPTGEGFYAINLADRNKSHKIIARPAAPKKKSGSDKP